MALLAGADAARSQGVEQATHDKHATAWRRWEEFAAAIELEDPYMDQLSPDDRILLLRAFMHAVRKGTWNRRGGKQVGADTAREALDHVCATITASGRGRQDPRLDSSL